MSGAGAVSDLITVARQSSLVMQVHNLRRIFQYERMFFFLCILYSVLLCHLAVLHMLHCYVDQQTVVGFALIRSVGQQGKLKWVFPGIISLPYCLRRAQDQLLSADFLHMPSSLHVLCAGLCCHIASHNYLLF